MAWRGMARQGKVFCEQRSVEPKTAGRGVAWLGEAWHGKARPGTARQGLVFQMEGRMAKAKADAEVNGGDERASVMKPEIVTFTIIGMSPLLQNNPAEFIGKDAADEMSRGKKVYKDDDEAALRVYRRADGSYQHPSESFVKSMLKAVSGMKFGKKFATQILKGSVFIVEPFCVIEDDKGRPATKYAIDRRPCVVGKARILRCRPCWHPWSMKLALDIDTALIQRSQVAQCLSLAGRTIGIGDYRPERGGGFGRFKVE